MSKVRVTLKLATSLDGKIALANGDSEWVTGEAARRAGRRLRAEHDGIAIGSNTAVIDNPQLTTRISDLPNPTRIVFDTRLRLDPASNLAQTANDVPVILLTGEGADDHDNLSSLGVTLITIPREAGHICIPAALDALSRMGITTLLLEGGGQLAAAFLRAGVIDTLEWFTAPILIGGDGRPCIAALELGRMSETLRFERVLLEELGPDLHERFERVA